MSKEYQSQVAGPQNLPIATRINTELRPQMEVFKNELAAVLPPHITPESMVRMALTACQDVPKLLDCKRPSLFRSIMTAAVLGLEVDAKIGQAYILPFWAPGGDIAQFIPGYKGYITLAQNSGYTVSAQVVREGDEFDYAFGSKQFIHHRPAGRLTGSVRGEIIGAYARAQNREGVEVFKVLELEDIFQSRNASASYKFHLKDPSKKSPWIDNVAAMYSKTAIRMLAPLLPLNVQRAAIIENHFERTGRAASLLPDLKMTDQGLKAGDIDAVLEGDDVSNGPTYTVKDQPDIMSEVGKEKCAKCDGRGVIEDDDGKSPCDCQGGVK